jgi:sugar phosphate isomerase/epimerase
MLLGYPPNNRSPNLRCAFDPENFVQFGVKPFSETYPLLEKYIDYIHIKDALLDGGKVVPAGDGDGEVLEVLKTQKEKGYSGFLSLDPVYQLQERSLVLVALICLKR